MGTPPARSTLYLSPVLLLLLLIGCGTVEEGTYEDDWASTPPVSVTARLEYRIDSLMNENRKLRQQMETLQTENTNLNARIIELQNRTIAPPTATRTTAPPSGAQPQAARTTTTTSRTTVTPGYESALAEYRKRNYQAAIDQFAALLNSGVSDNLADNCHYWIGESYYGLRNYREAIQAFERVLTVEGADKADDAQFMIGSSYAALGEKAAAKEAYQKLITLYPNSPLVSRARSRMTSL